jgi:isopentenyl diphosphate isomerase/L-lactate dehydrogenase-like FMN-dependent dehydrogenase
MAKDSIEALHEFYEPAKKALSKETWDYLMGGADTETTLERNRTAIDSVAFRPRVLRDVGKVTMRTKLMGHELRLPIILAPIGSLQDFCPPGGVAPTKAAASFGVLHMLSSVCKPGLEEVAAAAPGYPKLFQLYVRGNPDWVDERIATAIKHGYAGIALTVDLDYYGRRERDIAKRYKPTARRAGGEGAGDPHQARFSWEDIKRIRRNCKLPLILKGIATAEDAIMCVDHGIDVVYVSNHGGRQLDHGLGGLDVLPEVVEAVRGRAEVVVDGGFMRGTDVVKAIATGANAVGMGRLQGLALAAAGEAGVVRALELLEDEIIRTLGMLGVTSFGELDRRYLARATPLGRPGIASPFPLLREGY